MNWRAAGCLVVGATAFVAMGLLAMSLAFRGTTECPPSMQWADRAYQAVGDPAPSPVIRDGPPGEAAPIGSTFMGATTRRVYGPPGSTPSTDADDRPASISLECGDGTFQSYRWDGRVLSPAACPSSR